MKNPEQNQIITKGERSRAKIIAAARELIASHGFNAVTLQDVLDAAQVTKGKFFHHFESKEDLYSKLLRSTLDERGVLLFDEIVAKCHSKRPSDKLLFLLDRLIEWHNGGLPEVMRLCVFATFFFAPTSPEMTRINRLLAHNAGVIEELFRSSQQAKELPQDLDPTVWCYMFSSASIGSNTVQYLSGENKLTPRILVELRKSLAALQNISDSKKRLKS